jgi:hypothetical protein
MRSPDKAKPAHKKPWAYLMAIAAVFAYSVFWSEQQDAFRQQNGGVVGTYMDDRKDILVLRNASSKTTVCRVEIGMQPTSDYVMEPDIVRYIRTELLSYRWHCQPGTEYMGHIEKREE